MRLRLGAGKNKNRLINISQQDLLEQTPGSWIQPVKRSTPGFNGFNGSAEIRKWGDLHQITHSHHVGLFIPALQPSPQAAGE